MERTESSTPLEREWRTLLALRSEAREMCHRSLPAAAHAELRVRAATLQRALRHPLCRAVYAPLVARIAQGRFVIAQVGQSLDGRIATLGGDSHYVNGEAALTHLHRLRALCDCVIVGASTVVLDDPQLTTRRVEGPNPVRIALDPHRRIPPSARIFDDAAPSFAVCPAGEPAPPVTGRNELLIPAEDGQFAPEAVLDALAARGLRAVLIEGGGVTVSRFLNAGRLDRLHVMLAPMLIGPGRDAFRLPEIERLDAARRFRMAAHSLDNDVLLDCEL
jgi:riboflavin-specific deaminase-like protein